MQEAGLDDLKSTKMPHGFTNVVLITIDALRADHLGCYGYHRSTSPNIDLLAHEGTIFTRAFATGPTTPFSFPSIIASLYPLQLDGVGLPKSGSKTIAEVLQSHGCHTAAFNSNAFVSSRYNYDRGFETFLDPNNWTTMRGRLRGSMTDVLKRWPKLHRLIREVNTRLPRQFFSFTQKTAEQILEKAAYWITDLKGQPFFLWMHLIDVHHPYIVKREYLDAIGAETISQVKAKMLIDKLSREPDNIWKYVNRYEMNSVIDLYDSELAYTDAMIGRFLESSLDLAKTIVIITSDHGEEFGEHGGFHRIKPYDEMLHIPLIFAGPNVPKNVVVDESVSSIDIAPSILDLCGLPEEVLFEGETLLSIMRGERKEGVVISEYDRRRVDGDSAPEGKVFIIRNGCWKLIVREQGKEMYDLESDPKESCNMFEQHLEIANALRSKLTEHIVFLDAHRIAVKEVRLDKSLEDNLRALGYLD
ncbi:sulfatase-like hydrolase/transferase [candidate division WOR-3 bacterium]|nr:sulfatase-like hydrolase/transferase [candidate division WOR-3 bacterium]